jgi:hypothetical protein
MSYYQLLGIKGGAYDLAITITKQDPCDSCLLQKAWEGFSQGC